MAEDIGLLEVTGAVFHQVPRRNPRAGPAVDAVLSTSESTLEPRLRSFLRDRVTGSMRESAQPVIPLDEPSSPVPSLTSAWLQGAGPEIVEAFSELPDLLLRCQAHNSPPGLFAVLRCQIGESPAVAFLKVEHERGLSFDTITSGDDLRIELVIEEGLVLTEKTRVFKAAVFFLDSGSDDQEPLLHGLVTDDQSGSMYKGPSSQFWLDDFLGCRYSREADVQTRDWIRATQRTIQSDVLSPRAKDAALSALRAELASNRNTIDPRRFIEDYLPAESQDQALTRLRSIGAPTSAFRKSRQVSNAAPRRKTFHFDNELKVSMPNDVAPELYVEDVDGRQVDVMTIRGRIHSVS